MDEHRHDRLTVTAMIIAIILLVAVNLTFILMKPAGTGMERSVTEPGGGKTLATTAAARIRTHGRCAKRSRPRR